MACGCQGGASPADQYEPVFADGTVGKAGSKAEAQQAVQAKGGGYVRPKKAAATAA